MPDAEPVRVPAQTSAAKRRIANVAVDLFAAHGYRATPVKELMLACGLTPGALYNHFPSKEDLLATILLEFGAELTAALDAAEAGADPHDPADQLFRLVEAVALYALHNPQATKLANIDYVELGEANLKREIDFRRANRLRFEQILRAGLDSGVFTIPPFDGKNDIKLTATAMANLAIRLSEIQGPHPRGGAEELARFHARLALRMVVDHR